MKSWMIFGRSFIPFIPLALVTWSRQIDDTSSIDELGACLIVGSTLELSWVPRPWSYVEFAKGEDLEGNQIPVLPLWWKGWSECEQGGANRTFRAQCLRTPLHWQHMKYDEIKQVQKQVRRTFSTWQTAGRDRRSRNLLELGPATPVGGQTQLQNLSLRKCVFCSCVSVLSIEHVTATDSNMQ